MNIGPAGCMGEAPTEFGKFSGLLHKDNSLESLGCAKMGQFRGILVKIELEKFHFELPASVYRCVVVMALGFGVLGLMYVSRGATVQTEVSAHHVSTRIETGSQTRTVEVIPVPKISEEAEAANDSAKETPAPTNAEKQSQTKEQNQKTKKHADIGYYYVLVRVQGDADDEGEYVLVRRPCVQGMPICTLPPAVRKRFPLIED
jgi:hypothetical protein